MNTFHDVDIIGDIHGCGTELLRLLNTLGYTFKDNSYQHNDRKAVFVGDLINRGGENRLVVDTVRAMTKNGHAIALMGNHEMNALRHFYNCTNIDPVNGIPGNIRNIFSKFLDEYKNDFDEFSNVISWFSELPLFLNLLNTRVVHACWDESSIQELRPFLNPDNSLKKDGVLSLKNPNSTTYQAVYTLLNGIDITLPKGFLFTNSYGGKMPFFRSKWWLTGEQSYHSSIILQGGHFESIPDLPLPKESLPGYSSSSPPLFIGHYWLDSEPDLLQSNLVCLDYNTDITGGICAYRLCNTDLDLSKENIVIGIE